MATPAEMKIILDSLASINQRLDEDVQERKEILQNSKEMKDSLGKILTEVVGVRDDVEKNTNRIDYLEKEKRKRNLLIFGVPEKEKETLKDLEIKTMEIARIMKVDLKLEEVDYISRMGKNRTEGKNRPIIVSLTTLRRKIEMISNKKELKGTDYYIKEHFTKDIVDKRKTLMEEATKLRKEGKYAIVKFDKLIVKENNSQNSQTQGTSKNLKRGAVDSISPEMIPVQKGTNITPRPRASSFKKGKALGFQGNLNAFVTVKNKNQEENITLEDNNLLTQSGEDSARMLVNDDLLSQSQENKE